MLQSMLEVFQLENFPQSKILNVMLSVGACLFDSAFDGPSLISCQVSICNLLIHHACQAEWENGGPAREMGGCNKFCIGHHTAAKLLTVPEKHVAGATSELMKSILNEIQQELTSRRVVSILPPDSSEEESTEVKVSASIPSCLEYPTCPRQAL